MLMVARHKNKPIYIMFIVLFICTLFGLQQNIRLGADPLAQRDRNIFFGDSYDKCGPAFKLVHTRTRDGSTFHCLKTGLENVNFKIVAPNSTNDCSTTTIAGYSGDRAAVESMFGKLCVFMKEGYVDYKINYGAGTEPATPTAPGGQAPSSSTNASGSTQDPLGNNVGGESKKPEHPTVKRDSNAFKETDCSDRSCALYKDLNLIISFLAAGVGVIVVIMIIVGGIQYSAAGGDPQKVSAAKTKIFNAVLALVTFIFLYAILDWLIPGGLVSR